MEPATGSGDCVDAVRRAALPASGASNNRSRRCDRARCSWWLCGHCCHGLDFFLRLRSHRADLAHVTTSDIYGADYGTAYVICSSHDFWNGDSRSRLCRCTLGRRLSSGRRAVRSMAALLGWRQRRGSGHGAVTLSSCGFGQPPSVHASHCAGPKRCYRPLHCR